jgi:DNA-directed RNA polymerase specialized sigma24 family protein
VSTDLDLILAETENEDASPEELVVEYREHQNLRLAIKRLDERCHYLLNLLYYEASAPSYAEVAERLRIPIGSIGPMRARCLKKLRAIITRLNDGN